MKVICRASLKNAAVLRPERTANSCGPLSDPRAVMKIMRILCQFLIAETLTLRRNGTPAIVENED
jgi:hypothetical protein